MEIKITQIRQHLKKLKPDPSNLGFGRYFSDHMFLMDFNDENGWQNPRIVPYGPLNLDPAAAVLHYAQEVFDNHKAFRGSGGEIALFRPKDYLRRLANSAERMCIPAFPMDWIYQGLWDLLRIDRDWVPSAPLTALNIRHSIIATEPFLGVKPSTEYMYFIIIGPVGAFYSGGFSPVKILVEDSTVRAVPGGVGAAKTGGNYAAGLKAQDLALKKGYDQVLWLDGCERCYVEEVGAMNIFFKFKGELVTPPLTGTILPGITRDSVLAICRDLMVKASERPVSIDEVIEGAKSGQLQEVFGTGTAAVVAPVSELSYRGKSMIFSDGQAGRLAKKIFNTLTDIQYGKILDPHGWREMVVSP